MLKKLLLSAALLSPLGAWAQGGAAVVSLYLLIKGTSIEGARRAEEVNAPLTLDWPASATTPEKRAEEMKPVLKQALRGTIALNQRIDAHPDSLDLVRRRAALYAVLGDVRVRDDLAKIEKAGPTPPEFDALMAQTYLHTGAYTKAQASADAHLRRHPTDARLYELKALAELRRTKGEHLEHCRTALPDLDRALALDSTSFPARMLRGYAHAALHQTDFALADYRRALAQAPDNAQTHFFMAEALFDAGRNAEACQHLAPAEAFAPKITKVYRKKLCP